MGSRTVVIKVATFTQREKTENKNGFRRFGRRKRAKKPSLATIHSSRENLRKCPSCREKERKRNEV